jgi:hypothetical protein
MEYIRTKDKSGKPVVIRKIATLESALSEIECLRARVATQARTIRELRLEIDALHARYGLDMLGHQVAAE